MKRIFIIITLMTLSIHLFSNVENRMVFSEILNTGMQEQIFEQSCIETTDAELLQTTGDCTIKVKTEEFVGTVTFHDVNIFQCAWIKLLNLLS